MMAGKLPCRVLNGFILGFTLTLGNIFKPINSMTNSIILASHKKILSGITLLTIQFISVLDVSL